MATWKEYASSETASADWISTSLSENQLMSRPLPRGLGEQALRADEQEHDDQHEGDTVRVARVDVHLGHDLGEGEDERAEDRAGDAADAAEDDHGEGLEQER